ncbi:hypothetical protein B0T24DRAFT_360146 [Lasiosphaeria ovina]|uniref:Uncharacterized protein n=1 Tax=Lasiosphaeria ovina TaxID=92902 RepID=A0AAE0K4D9_9PEZI|nr:hypothetical protein B0T24DRAFT_360146 [Lasiosphaeria ovina]
MGERLQPRHGCLGLQYAAINWPDHVRRAQYTPQEFREQVLPLLNDWFKVGQGRYQSWQEAHAYYCSSSTCPCDVWQKPETFLDVFGLLELNRKASLGAGGEEKHEGDSGGLTTHIGVQAPHANQERTEESRCRAKVDCQSCGGRHSTHAPAGHVLSQTEAYAVTPTARIIPDLYVCPIAPQPRIGKKQGDPRQEQIRRALQDSKRRNISNC